MVAHGLARILLTGVIRVRCTVITFGVDGVGRSYRVDYSGLLRGWACTASISPAE